MWDSLFPSAVVQWNLMMMRQKKVFLPPDDEETQNCHIWYNNGPKYIQPGLHTSCPHVPFPVNLAAFYYILLYIVLFHVSGELMFQCKIFELWFSVCCNCFIFFKQFLCRLLQYMRVLWVIKRSNSLKSNVPSPIWARFPALLAGAVWTFRCNREFFLK